MSSKFEPTHIDLFDNEQVKQYDLPVGEETSVLYLDTKEEGYAAEWNSPIDLNDFRSLVLEIFTGDVEESVATFQPRHGCRPNHSDNNITFEAIESSRFYPDECTYLQRRGKSYDIAWEEWEPANSIVLTSHIAESEPLTLYFSETSGPPFYDTEGELLGEETGSRLFDRAVEEAYEIISEDL